MPSNDYIDLACIRLHPRDAGKRLGNLDELADSIREQGLLQPLVVRPIPQRDGEYELVLGRRRFAAAHIAGVERVLARVRYGLSDTAVLILQTVENWHRLELTPLEKAEAIERLREEEGMTIAEISKTTGIASSSISSYLALLTLDETSREQVRAGTLTASQAIEAVREVRKRQRKKDGSQATWQWQPEHFSDEHTLAAEAKQRCDGQGHGPRRRLGGVACGACWEQTIRQDERAVVAAMTADIHAITGATDMVAV